MKSKFQLKNIKNSKIQMKILELKELNPAKFIKYKYTKKTI